MHRLVRRFLLSLSLVIAAPLHASGVTIDPGSGTGSGTSTDGSAGGGASDGSLSGGITQGTPVLTSYVPGTTPQANGSSSSTTTAGDPVNMVPAT